MNRVLFLILFLSLTQNITGQADVEVLFDRTSVTIVNGALKDELKVYRGNFTLEELAGRTSIIGRKDRMEVGLIFTPLVDFDFNTNYTCVYKNEVFHFKIDLPTGYEYLNVEVSYPTSMEVPSNLLKIYIQFSRPISTGNLQDKIFLRNSEGEILDRAFLPLESPLINEEGTILTLWIEPGRQKRGLGPNERLGAVLHEGEEYVLTVSKNLVDRNGIPMQEDYFRRISVISSDREKPKWKHWKVTIPTHNDHGELEIQFNESLDFGSTLNAFKIMNEYAVEIHGEWKLSREEKSVTFFPQRRWQPGAYEILCNVKIEDLAANNLLRLFDSKVDERKEIHDQIVKLPFSID